MSDMTVSAVDKGETVWWSDADQPRFESTGIGPLVDLRREVLKPGFTDPDVRKRFMALWFVTWIRTQR